MQTEHRTIDSPRFGSIEVDTAALIRFDGLPGFPELEHFAVFQHDRESPFGWLQSAERPELAFPVTDPRQFFPNYRPALRLELLAFLDAEGADELEWLAIATIGEGKVELNLAAPLLINPRNRRGVQAILEEGDWSAREPLTTPAQTESKPHTKRGQGSRVESAAS